MLRNSAQLQEIRLVLGSSDFVGISPNVGSASIAPLERCQQSSGAFVVKASGAEKSLG